MSNAIRIGVNAIACVTCRDMARRKKRYTGAINTAFVSVSFDEWVRLAHGDKLVKTATCQGDAPFGQHTNEYPLRAIGNISDEQVDEDFLDDDEND